APDECPQRLTNPAPQPPAVTGWWTAAARPAQPSTTREGRGHGAGVPYPRAHVRGNQPRRREEGPCHTTTPFRQPTQRLQQKKGGLLPVPQRDALPHAPFRSAAVHHAAAPAHHPGEE